MLLIGTWLGAAAAPSFCALPLLNYTARRTGGSTVENRAFPIVPSFAERLVNNANITQHAACSALFLLNNVIKTHRQYKRSSSSKVVLPSSEVMCNAPKYCHTTDLFVRDPNFLHATSRTTRTASFEANYCWMKDR